MPNWKEQFTDAIHSLGFKRKGDLDPNGTLEDRVAYDLQVLLGDDVDRSQWGKQKVSDILQDAALLDKLTEQGYSIRANSTITQAVNEMLAAVGIKKAIDATGSVVEVSEFVNSSYQTTPDGAPITDNGRGPLQRDHGAGINFSSKYPQGGQPPAGHSSWVSAVTNGRDGRSAGFTQQHSRPANDAIKPSDIAAQQKQAQQQQQQATEQMQQQQRDAAAREARFAAMMQDRANTARDAQSWQAHVSQQQAGMVR